MYTPKIASNHVYQFNFSEKRMQRYFSHYLPKIVLFFMLGIILIGISFLRNILLILGAIPLITGCVISIVAMDGPTDEQYRGWLAERADGIYYRALQRLHLTEAQIQGHVLLLKGYVYKYSAEVKDRTYNAQEALTKRLKYGGTHFSINLYTYIFLLEDSVAVFSSDINALNQFKHLEETHHYYYEHIVGISVIDNRQAHQWDSKNRRIEVEIKTQQFYLKIDNGDSVGIESAIYAEIRSYHKSTQTVIAQSDIDDTVTALLMLLRDHKISLMKAAKSFGQPY